MNEKKIYGRWFIWEEFVGIPMIVYHWIKGDRIKKLLSERIDKARKNGEQVELTEKIKQEFLIEYERLDNFFSYYFRFAIVDKIISCCSCPLRRIFYMLSFNY